MAVVSASSVHGGASPSLEQVRQLAQDHNLIPLSETFIDDCQTPVSAFLKLREERPAFLLESAEQGRVGRYSFIGFRPRSVLRTAVERDAKLALPVVSRGETNARLEAMTLDPNLARVYTAARHRVVEEPDGRGTVRGADARHRRQALHVRSGRWQ